MVYVDSLSFHRESDIMNKQSAVIVSLEYIHVCLQISENSTSGRLIKKNGV